MNWESLRSDLRAFGRLARYNIPHGEDSRLARELLRGERMIPLVGADMQMLALVLCWRVACWPRSTTLIVTPCERISRKLIRLARDLMSEADEELRDRVWFTARGQGMTCANSDVVGAVHCSSGTLGMNLPLSNEPLTFLVPDLNLIPGCHLKYLPKAASRNGTTVIVNSARRGRVL